MTTTRSDQPDHERERSLPGTVTLKVDVTVPDAAVIAGKAKDLGMTVGQWIYSHLEGPIRYARESAVQMKKRRRDRD